MESTFTGWPEHGPALLAAIAEDNSREFWAEHRHRHATEVLGPMRALATALAGEFGPVRGFRPFVNRRFRPDAPLLRTDVGGVATTAGGCTLGVVLSATRLSVSAGVWGFDGMQRRGYRSAVDGPAGEELARILSVLPGSIDPARISQGSPRGHPPGHPRTALLRRSGLQVEQGWDLGPWIHTAAPLGRVRDAWRAAAPLVDWLEAHVGPPAPPRPRPPRPAAPDVGRAVGPDVGRAVGPDVGRADPGRDEAERGAPLPAAVGGP